MLEALRRAGRLCLVGFQALHSEDIRFIKDRIVSGRLGRVSTLACWAGWPRPAAYYARNDWAGRLRAGGAWVLDGPATNALAHQVANMLFLASPEPDRLASPSAVRAELYAAGPIESHDTAAIEILTAEGPRAHFLATHCSETVHEPIIEIQAERARVSWAMRKGLTISYHDGSRETFGFDFQQHGRMVANFVQAVRATEGGAPPAGGFGPLGCPLSEARKVVLALNGAHESSRAVHRVPESDARREGEGESARTVIPGIDRWLEQAAASGTLLSDLRDGPPWSVRTERFSLEGYRQFPQVFRA